MRKKVRHREKLTRIREAGKLAVGMPQIKMSDRAYVVGRVGNWVRVA